MDFDATQYLFFAHQPAYMADQQQPKELNTVNPSISFSNILSNGSSQTSKPANFSIDDFPVLGANKSQTREEILISNLLGNVQLNKGPGKQQPQQPMAPIGFGKGVGSNPPPPVVSMDALNYAEKG